MPGLVGVVDPLVGRGRIGSAHRYDPVVVPVETDSSDAYLADVNLEFNRWTCLPAGNPEGTPALVADITGRTCALDVIVPDAELPPVEPGDVLAFLDTGAYQDAGASNFNA